MAGAAAEPAKNGHANGHAVPAAAGYGIQIAFEPEPAAAGAAAPSYSNPDAADGSLGDPEDSEDPDWECAAGLREGGGSGGETLLACDDGLASTVVFGGVPSYADETSHAGVAAEADLAFAAPALQGAPPVETPAGDEALPAGEYCGQAPASPIPDFEAQDADYEQAGEPEMAAPSPEILDRL
jgi:hypothetical protein